MILTSWKMARNCQSQEAWVESYKLGKMLIVDADNYNFPESPEDLSVVIDKINADLHGLFK